MATANYMLYVATHGADDPMRAGLAIRAAIAAAPKTGARVALLGTAIFLMKEEVARNILVQVAPRPAAAAADMKFQTLSSLLQDARKVGVTFHV